MNINKQKFSCSRFALAKLLDLLPQFSTASAAPGIVTVYISAVIGATTESITYRYAHCNLVDLKRVRSKSQCFSDDRSFCDVDVQNFSHWSVIKVLSQHVRLSRCTV